MFAIIKTGGKQYKVAAGDKIKVEKLDGEAGDKVSFDEVLMLDGKVGTPLVSGVSVGGKIIEQTRGDKIIVFKKKRRQNYRRKKGHRQDLTLVEITEVGGKTAPAKKAAAKKTEEKKAEPKKAAAKKADAPKKEAKTTAKKAPAKKTETKKAAEKKAPAKKTAAKKTTAKKTTAKKKDS